MRGDHERHDPDRRTGAGRDEYQVASIVLVGHGTAPDLAHTTFLLTATTNGKVAAFVVVSQTECR
jgi:hypothetical protein